jgi:hypothetical protein
MIDEKQVQEADAAVTRAVTVFVSEFESMWGEMGKRRSRTFCSAGRITLSPRSASNCS